MDTKKLMDIAPPSMRATIRRYSSTMGCGDTEAVSAIFKEAVKWVRDSKIDYERILTGWSEIGAYFGMTGRTVQKWNLPVKKNVSGKVYIKVYDLEEWRAENERV